MANLKQTSFFESSLKILITSPGWHLQKDIARGQLDIPPKNPTQLGFEALKTPDHFSCYFMKRNGAPQIEKH